MNSISKKHKLNSDSLTQEKIRYLQLILPLLAIVSLVACGTSSIDYEGTCAEQTEQYLDYIHTLVVDEFTPVIEDGFNSRPTATMKKIEEFETRVNKLDTPECNAETQAVKDALLLYMSETRSAFTLLNASSVGHDAFQEQLTKMNEAGLAFEKAFEALRK